MSRILKRPMFRKGGPVMEGIMDGIVDRQQMQTGGSPGFESAFEQYETKQNQKQIALRNLQRTPNINEQYRKKILDLQATSALDEGYLGDTNTSGLLSFLESPQGKEAFVADRTKDIQTKIKEAEKIGLGSDTLQKQKDRFPLAKTTGEVDKPGDSGASKKTQPSPKNIDDDIETVKSYMSMFKELTKDDEDDINRERFLQLAKFGANLVAQPGGSLTRAIGRAAIDPLSQLGRIERTRRATDKALELEAAKFALGRVDDPTLMKVKSLAKALKSDDAEIRGVAQKLLGTDSKTRAQQIEARQKVLNVPSTEIGLNLATKIVDKDLNNETIVKFPLKKGKKDPSKVEEGIYYYDEQGKLFQGTGPGTVKPVK
jgi:hypothetical protein